MPASPEPVRLIVGMSRGGTTALMVALNADHRVAAFGETAFWGRLWVEPGSDGRYDADRIGRIVSRLRGMRCVPFGEDGLSRDGTSLGDAMADAVDSVSVPATPLEVFRAMGDAVAAACDRDIAVEKTPHHLMHLDRVFVEDPGARVVVMLRSPAAFLRSYKHQGDRKAEPARSNFRRLYHPMIASLVCRGSLRAAAAAIGSHPDQVRISGIETIRREPESELAAIRRHLRLPEFDDVSFRQVNSSFEGRRGEASGNLPSLTSAERTWLALLCSRSARAVGLEVPKAGWGMLAIPWSMALLVPWLLRNRSLLGGMDRAGIRGLLRRWVRR